MDTDTYTQRVADTVRAEMARRRVGHQRLAVALGVSRGSVHRRLSGQLPFDVAELSVIADLLGIPVADLISERRAS